MSVSLNFGTLLLLRWNMAAVYTVIVYKKKKVKKCLLDIVLLTAKFQFNEKSWLIVLHYTFSIFKLKPIRIFSITKPLWIFAAPPPLTHTRAREESQPVPREESQPVPRLLCSSWVLDGRSYQYRPPRTGGLPPQDLKLWPFANLRLWVFTSCGKMMCLSLPRPLPGVCQHYLMSSNSVIFL